MKTPDQVSREDATKLTVAEIEELLTNEFINEMEQNLKNLDLDNSDLKREKIISYQNIIKRVLNYEFFDNMIGITSQERNAVKTYNFYIKILGILKQISTYQKVLIPIGNGEETEASNLCELLISRSNSYLDA